ncbi:hypothetical protein JW968_03250 [Candidatus Woesearchaeota archaeon]|nr:hypothetical protein [Candidatus Woesearchaeota archaeon]
MKNKIIMALLISSILVFTGCTEQESSTSKTNPFVGGDTGLTIQFEPDSPPAEVYDGGSYPFGIVVRIKNVGETNVLPEDATIKITGIDPNEFNVNTADLIKHPEDELIRTKKDAEGNILEGTTTFVSFDDLNHVDPLTASHLYPIKAEVCYEYATQAISDICVRENLLDTKKEGVCMINEDKQVFSSAAPVKVEEFKEIPRASDKVAFQFKVKHKGTGDIFKRDSNCAQNYTIENKVWVEVTTGIEGLSCSGLTDGTAPNNGYVTVFGNPGERIVACTQAIANPADYEKPVNIRLEYDYLQDITTTLLVKHEPLE